MSKILTLPFMNALGYVDPMRERIGEVDFEVEDDYDPPVGMYANTVGAVCSLPIPKELGRERYSSPWRVHTPSGGDQWEDCVFKRCGGSGPEGVAALKAAVIRIVMARRTN